MATNKKNQAQILEAWTPAIKQITKNAVNESNVEKLAWMAEYAHNHAMAMNEEAMGGASFPFQTLANTNGIGNAVPASQAGMTAVGQNQAASYGSGDKWPALLPMALQVAARTIGFDLVNTIPLQGPTGVLPFMDYVYAGSKDAYGATPSYNGATANPQNGTYLGQERTPAYEMYEAPHAFRCKLAAEDKTAAVAKLRRADYITIGEMKVVFIGLTRISAEPMFRVLGESKNVALGKVFGAEGNVESVVIFYKEKNDEGELVEKTETVAMTLSRPRLISALEDQIQGFTGAGRLDSDKWSGTFHSDEHLYEPMDRATGEMQYPRQMSLKVFTKFVQVGTQSIAVAVTQEQVQDLQKQWGINVISLVETAAINELSQSINKHILSRLFALGWRNHVEAYESEGINLNISLTGVAGTKTCVTYFDDAMTESQVEMPVPAIQKYGDFENSDTVFKKLGVNLLAAGNLVMNRGRRGPANFCVMNWKLATMLQSNSQYAFSPLANTLNQNNGSLYPAGTIAGMTVYVDPLMATYDTRILVGRKGDKQEPGVAMCPYIMAESVKLIAEHTAAPKVIIKSRYALVDLGFYPELNYVTFYVKAPDQIV